MSTLSLWTRRDPFAELDTFFQNARPSGFTPAAEVVREGDDAVVRLELPGLDAAKDVTVEIDRNRLIVHGERRDERSAERAGRTLREVRYGSFTRSFGLPAHVSADAVTATYDAGVLSVRVSGAHAAPSTARQIPVQTGAVTEDAPEHGTTEQPAA